MIVTTVAHILGSEPDQDDPGCPSDPANWSDQDEPRCYVCGHTDQGGCMADTTGRWAECPWY